MTGDRVQTAARPLVEADGSAVPARLRIAAWITLATAVGMLAVVLTIRSALQAGVDRDADAGIRQELDEFRTFVAEGRVPATGARFDASSPVLELYLQRQFPAAGEVLLGWDPRASDADSAAVVQDVPRTYGLGEDTALLRELALGDAAAGTASTGEESFRWGRTVVLDGSGEPGAVLVVADVLTPKQVQAAETLRLVVLVCLGGLALTSLFSLAVAGAILAPVRAVRRAAAGITRTDLSRRIEVQGRDDVAALATTFNAMLDRLESSFHAQHRVVRVAHRDLQAPLAVVGDAAATPAERDRAAAEVASTLDAMELLTASQLPGFAALGEHAVEDLGRDLLAHARAATPGSTWEGHLGATGTAEVDAVLLAAAVAALARNAATEHVGPAPLRLGTDSDADAVEVWVQDDGPGLDDDHAQHVLDRYTDPSAGPGTDSGAVPTGLGLGVVRAVADAHEGSAWVETSPGAGARFGLRLPRRAGDPGDLKDLRDPQLATSSERTTQ